MHILQILELGGDRFKYQEVENIYLTGHSLGGFQAYSAFLKMNKIFNERKNNPNSILRFVKNISVVNFNGPGLDSNYKELKKLYEANLIL